MNTEIFNNPDVLLEKGFSIEEENTSDSVRWVYFRRTIPIKKTGYQLVVVITYLLSISDTLNVKYTDNLYYSFEKAECILRAEDGTEIFTITPEINSLSDLDKLDNFFN
jgi:hypothetical protein